jgi:hypothetical protein
MNVTDQQQVIDDFERLLCELTEKRKLSLVTAEKAVNIYTLALLNLRDIVLARVNCKFIYCGKLFYRITNI